MLCWSTHAWNDYIRWQKENPRIQKKINDLIKEIMRTPFAGSGKPEPLRHDLTGCWSRRIDREHRLVYRVADGRVDIIACRQHY